MKRSVPVVLAVALLAACSGAPEVSQETSITVQVSGEREETAVYRAIVQAYKNDHPETTVTLVEVPEKDDHLTKLASSFAVGDPPDVFLVNFREYSQFVARGAIDPYGSYVDDLAVDLGDYYPAPLEAFTFNGELQCMPQNISSLVVYYNTDLFAKAGVDPPSAGWTWDEFRAAGEALTKGDVRGIGIEPSIIRIAPFVWSNGGEIVDDPAAPTGFTLDGPAAKEALDFVVSLAHDELIPTEKEIVAQDLETRFVTSKLAMMLSSRRDVPAFREVRGLNWDVGPLPIADEPVGILHSDGYCISTGSGAPGTATDFVAFATGEQGQTLAALGGRTVPSLVSVSESGAFLDPTQPPASSQVFLDGIANLRRTPVLPTWSEIEDLAEEILTRAFYEPGYTIDDTIDALRSATEDLFVEGVEELQ